MIAITIIKQIVYLKILKKTIKKQVYSEVVIIMLFQIMMKLIVFFGIKIFLMILLICIELLT